MTPAQFLNEIVTPNVTALSGDVGDLRLAVNAILTLDALAGVIHDDLYKRGLVTTDDDVKYRETLASVYPEYRIVRDAAFALKHGELRFGKRPRLVRRADQVTSYSGAWDEAVWDRSAWDTPAVVWIEADDPGHSRRVDEVTQAVLAILQGMI
jgi:hypothetical protein